MWIFRYPFGKHANKLGFHSGFWQVSGGDRCTRRVLIICPCSRHLPIFYAIIPVGMQAGARGAPRDGYGGHILWREAICAIHMVHAGLGLR
jgi:hypothetical protein